MKITNPSDPFRPQIISSQYSSTGTTDSIASSYRPPDSKIQHAQLRSPTLTQSSSGITYPHEFQQPRNLHVADELINHPTIMKLQKENFNRLLSSAASTVSSTSTAKQQNSQLHLVTTNDRVAIGAELQSIKQTSDTQRAVLYQRKQALMKAIQSINKQMEELDM